MPSLPSLKKKSQGWRRRRGRFSEGLGYLQELQRAEHLCQASPAVATGGPGATGGLATAVLFPPFLLGPHFFLILSNCARITLV
jgi:hypothetical protein